MRKKYQVYHPIFLEYVIAYKNIYEIGKTTLNTVKAVGRKTQSNNRTHLYLYMYNIQLYMMKIKKKVRHIEPVKVDFNWIKLYYTAEKYLLNILYIEEEKQKILVGGWCGKMKMQKKKKIQNI